MYLENTFYFIFFGIGPLVGHQVILTTIKNPEKNAWQTFATTQILISVDL